MIKLSQWIIPVAALASVSAFANTSMSQVKSFDPTHSFFSEVDVTASAFGVDWALDGKSRILENHEMPQVCKDVGVTPEQKTALKEAMFTYWKAMIAIKAEIQTVHVDYFRLLMDPVASRADADVQVTRGSESVGKAASTTGQFANTILFTILLPEQRSNAIECGMAVLKAKMEKALERACRNVPKP